MAAVQPNYRWPSPQEIKKFYEDSSAEHNVAPQLNAGKEQTVRQAANALIYLLGQYLSATRVEIGTTHAEATKSEPQVKEGRFNKAAIWGAVGALGTAIWLGITAKNLKEANSVKQIENREGLTHLREKLELFGAQLTQPSDKEFVAKLQNIATAKEKLNQGDLEQKEAYHVASSIAAVGFIALFVGGVAHASFLVTAGAVAAFCAIFFALTIWVYHLGDDSDLINSLKEVEKKTKERDEIQESNDSYYFSVRGAQYVENTWKALQFSTPETQAPAYSEPPPEYYSVVMAAPMARPNPAPSAPAPAVVVAAEPGGGDEPAKV